MDSGLLALEGLIDLHRKTLEAAWDQEGICELARGSDNGVRLQLSFF